MRVIVCGSRNWKDKKYIYNILNQLPKDIILIVGGCQGADQIAEQWAKEKDIPCMVFKAEWQKYGKAAGPKRNKEMLDFADEVIAFHDNLNSSKGTKHMVSIAREANIPTVVYP